MSGIATMRDLYPAIDADVVEQLEAGDGHTLHVEQCGNRDGLPVLFLHGGPGGGCKPDHRRFFDPARYRVFLVDQRGAGRSRPVGSVSANTTTHLIADLELIRHRYGVRRWVLFGGSWGAALALAYAQAHPEQVSGLVLRGTFLARRRDVAWFYATGARRLLPVQWQRFVDELAVPPARDVAAHLYESLFADDPRVVERAARAWDSWSGAVVMFSLDQTGPAAPGPVDTVVAKARIEMHYAHHGYFLPENALLDRMARIPRIPAVIVHGARDITCPAEAGWLVHRALPGSRLEIVPTAGHLSSERPMVDALVRAADEIAQALA